MNQQAKTKTGHNPMLFTCFLIFALCLLTLPTVHAAETVTVSLDRKEGEDHDPHGTSEGDVEQRGSDDVWINGTWANYKWNIKEYAPWIKEITVKVRYRSADQASCSNNAWPALQVRRSGSAASYDHWQDLTSTSSNNTTKDDSSTNISRYVGTIDGDSNSDHNLTVRIRAENCFADNADVVIEYIDVDLELEYNKNAIEIQGGPKVLNFGVIDLGQDYSLPVTFDRIGDNTGNVVIEVKDPPTWVQKFGPNIVNRPTTFDIAILSAALNSTNIAQLSEALVPVDATTLDPDEQNGITYARDLDPQTRGLKGDFYHWPDDNQEFTNLDDAWDDVLNNSNTRLVFSDIFPEIDFQEDVEAPSDPDFESNEHFADEQTSSIDVKSVPVTGDFVAVFTGFIKIEGSPSEEAYEFFITSADGFRLKIDKNRDGSFSGETVAEYTGTRGRTSSSNPSRGTMTLANGIYPVELTYFQGLGSKMLVWEWKRPGSGTREIVPSSALHNGLNILVLATPKKPTVTIDTPLDSNGRVNVTKDAPFTFTATGTEGSTGVAVNKYVWQLIKNSVVEHTDNNDTDGTFNVPGSEFSDPGDIYEVTCKAIDAKGVESDVQSIRVRVWNRPEVLDEPPSAAIPARG